METVWTPELIEQLAVFWKQGLSTAEIGRRLGVSKNAVVGKAHRLLLDPRPSPLKRPPVRRVVGITAPACSWPTGHPGERDFRFCGKRPLPGKPYCAEHAELAYVKPKVEKSNAA
jgi:GcrA cell cycle regulator